ncbi:hypothetical protein BDP27DRAFT_1491026, partial [Rhodocollybia butyracea]
FSTLLLIVLSFVLIPPRSGLGTTSVRLYCLYLTIRSLVYKLGTLYYCSSAKNHELHELQAIPVIAHFSELSLSLSLFLILAVLSDTSRLGSVLTSDISWTILMPIPWSDLGDFSHFTFFPSGTTLVVCWGCC